MQLKFYMDEEKKILNSQLLEESAEKVASGFIEGNNQVSSSQLRKFYNEIKGLEKKNEITDWEIIFPLVKMVKSKVAYATAPKKIKWNDKNVYSNFKNFINEGLNSIQDEKDFLAFCKYFEAVVGYYYGKGGK